MAIKKSEEKCTSLLALFTAFSCSVLLNFLAKNRRRPLVWQYRRTLRLEIPRIWRHFACKCCWTSLKKPPESTIFLISSVTPNEAITLMFSHLIPAINKPDNTLGTNSLWRVCNEETWAQVSLKMVFLSWSWELGCKVMTSRAFGQTDFWFPISDFCFRQSQNTCHQFLGSDSWNSEKGLATKPPDSVYI